MNKWIAVLVTTGLFVLAGCGAQTPPSETTPAPELATSLEDIAGIWEGINGGGGFMQFELDGTYCIAEELEWIENGPRITIGNVRFEGTQLFITDTEREIGGTDEVCDRTGIYEVQLLANGNLKFVAIEDECVQRSPALQGAEGINVEFRRVP